MFLNLSFNSSFSESFSWNKSNVHFFHWLIKQTNSFKLLSQAKYHFSSQYFKSSSSVYSKNGIMMDLEMIVSKILDLLLLVAKMIQFGSSSSHVFKKALIAALFILSIFSSNNIFFVPAGESCSRSFISLVHKSL